VIIYKPFAKIHAISFDLDDTFYANWPYIVEAEQYLRSYISEHYPQAAYYSSSDWFGFKNAALKEDPELRHDMGALRLITLRSAFEKSGLPKADINQAVKKCFDAFYFKRSDFKVDDDIHHTLATLARKVPLVAITNGNVNLQQIGIDTYFTHVLHATKEQRMKPYPDMFNKAATLLSLAPEHILHVGDNLEKDVWGATRAGFKSAWFAYDRPMNLNTEQVLTLPHVQLDSLASIEYLLTD
jgi:putative hydrolase of the HAD superfamily